MDSNILKRRGFSLAELSLVFMVASVFFSAVVCSAAKIRQAASAQRAIEELVAIAAAGSWYYSEHGAWPASLADLRPGYLTSQSTAVNPFGNAYTITSNTFSLSVSTLLPKGLVSGKSYGSEVVVTNQGDNDLLSITTSPETRNWKLKYEKKYIYKE
jgi:type II secretory pathway pseudopilin PulG